MARITIKKPGEALESPNINDGETRDETDSRDLATESRPDVVEDEDRQFSVEAVDVLDKDYADTIAFFEEPVTIVLHPSGEDNPITAFPVWVNGKAAEVFQRGRWDEIGYLPVGRQIVIKRKVLSVIIGAKVTRIQTEHASESQRDDAFVENRIKSFTRPLNGFSVIHDRNPAGGAWLEEQMRRNM